MVSFVVSSSAFATEKPRFVEELKTLEVSEGNSVCFTVRVSGYPAPRVTWYRNNVPILPGYSPYFEILSSATGDNQHSLRIREVFSEDAGRIVAKAENVAGSVSCSAELIVKGLDCCLLPDLTYLEIGVVHGRPFSR